MMANEIKVSYEEWSEISDGFKTDRFDIEEKGEWISEGKYENKFFVVKEKATGKFYGGNTCRSGSYYTEYEYMDEYEKDEGGNMVLDEVKKVPVTKHEWVLVGGEQE